MIYRILCLMLMSIICAATCAVEKDIFKYDPNAPYIEAIVTREHNGLKEYLKYHLADHNVIESFKNLDKYQRTPAHYAALIEDEELVDLLKKAGVDMYQDDVFGYSADDYLKKRYCKCDKCDNIL